MGSILNCPTETTETKLNDYMSDSHSNLSAADSEELNTTNIN